MVKRDMTMPKLPIIELSTIEVECTRARKMDWKS